MLKSTRPFTLLTHPALRIRPRTRFSHSLLRRQGQVNIQPVRFQRPPLRYSRVLRLAFQFAIAGYLFYIVNEYVLGYEEEDDERGVETAAPSIVVAPKPLQQGVEGTKAPETENVEEMLVQLPDKLPEGALFIPLWTGKQQPAKFYKNSDPEWQGYLKFARDENQMRKVKENFCTHLLAGMKPVQKKVLGTPFRIERTMLYFDYPRAPLPEYERPGLEIADEYIALTSRPQSYEHYKRVASIMWPENTLIAFWSGFKALCIMKSRKIRSFLKVKTESAESDLSMPPDPFSLHSMAEPPHKKSPLMESKLEKLPDPKSTHSKTSGATATSSGTAKHSTNGGSPDRGKIVGSLPTFSTFGKFLKDELLVVMAVASSLLHTSRRPIRVDDGDIFLFGTVEVAGSKAKIFMDVRAAFHPGSTDFKDVQMVTRKIIPARLRPQA